MLMGLCILCVGCGSTPSKKTPSLDAFNERTLPHGGADAAQFARTTY
jgi:hypothetical protein